MDPAPHGDRLNVLDLAEDFEVHAPVILSRHFDIWTSTQRLNVQPRAARDFRCGLDLRPARLGGCNVLLGRFRSAIVFWRVMSRVIAGTKRCGTTMTVCPRARN